MVVVRRDGTTGDSILTNPESGDEIRDENCTMTGGFGNDETLTTLDHSEDALVP
jgi:hypothetical protein